MSTALSYDDHLLLLEFACLEEILGFNLRFMYEHGFMEFVDTLTGRKVVWGMGMTKTEVFAAVQGLQRILTSVPKVTFDQQIATAT